MLLLFRFNLYQGSVWFTSANAVSGRVLEWESDFLSYITLGERNKELMQKNLVLEQRVMIPPIRNCAKRSCWRISVWCRPRWWATA